MAGVTRVLTHVSMRSILEFIEKRNNTVWFVALLSHYVFQGNKLM